MKKYIVRGGKVISKSDGDEHYVDTASLCRLYGVKLEECICISEFDRTEGLPTLPILKPRYDGNYTLPEAI